MTRDHRDTESFYLMPWHQRASFTDTSERARKTSSSFDQLLSECLDHSIHALYASHVC